MDFGPVGGQQFDTAWSKLLIVYNSTNFYNICCNGDVVEHRSDDKNQEQDLMEELLKARCPNSCFTHSCCSTVTQRKWAQLTPAPIHVCYSISVY